MCCNGGYGASLRPAANKHVPHDMKDDTMNKALNVTLKTEPGNDAATPHPTDDPANVVQLAPHRDENRKVAIRMAEAGLRVIPVRVTFNAQTRHWDKPPIINGWQKKATTNPKVINRWWEQYPEALPGILLTDFVVIDCDRHGGPDGVAAFETLVEENGGPPSGPVTLTAGNGKHFYFRQPDGAQLGCRPGSLPDGVEARGGNVCILAPGSVRPDGEVWLPDPTAPSLEDALAEGTIPVIPDWLVEIIRTKPQPPGAGLAPSIVPSSESADAPGRGRAYALKALQACEADLVAARSGERNNKANAVAFHMGTMVGRAWIDRAEVIRSLTVACEKNGLAHDDGITTVQATLISGIDAGCRAPHPDLEDRPLFPAHGNDASEVVAADQDGAFPGYWDGDGTAPTPPKWLIRDLLPERGVMLLLGESGAAKTFLALHAAAEIGAGEPFFGKETKRGGTLYLAAEASDLIPERLDAARLGVVCPAVSRQRDAAPTFEVDQLPIYVVTAVPDLLSRNNESLLLEKIAEQCKSVSAYRSSWSSSTRCCPHSVYPTGTIPRRPPRRRESSRASRALGSR
jgi:Bifunctional DNA primase/polymerase, N-terminal/AAA domain